MRVNNKIHLILEQSWDYMYCPISMCILPLKPTLFLYNSEPQIFETVPKIGRQPWECIKNRENSGKIRRVGMSAMFKDWSMLWKKRMGRLLLEAVNHRSCILNVFCTDLWQILMVNFSACWCWWHNDQGKEGIQVCWSICHENCSTV